MSAVCVRECGVDMDAGGTSPVSFAAAGIAMSCQAIVPRLRGSSWGKAGRLLRQAHTLAALAVGMASGQVWADDLTTNLERRADAYEQIRAAALIRNTRGQTVYLLDGTRVGRIVDARAGALNADELVAVAVRPLLGGGTVWLARSAYRQERGRIALAETRSSIRAMPRSGLANAHRTSVSPGN